MGLAVMSFIYTLLYGYSSVLDGVQNAARRRMVIAWHNGCAAWLRFAAAFCLVTYYGISSHIAMAGFAVASALILISQLYFFYQNFLKATPLRPSLKKADFQKWTRKMISYAWPFASWGTFLWGLSVADRWALGVFNDTETVGLYTALFQLGYYPMVFLFLVVSQVATPILFGRSGAGRDPDKINEAHSLNNVLTIGFLALTVGLFLFSFQFNDKLFSLIVANQYQQVAGFLPWMILAGGLFFTGQNTSQLFMIQTNTWLLALPLTTTSILGIIIIFVGAYYWGLSGVVYARVAVSAIHLLCILILAKTSLKKSHKIINSL
jgi:O-antigen/teichoic acid export membrane protein